MGEIDMVSNWTETRKSDSSTVYLVSAKGMKSRNMVFFRTSYFYQFIHSLLLLKYLEIQNKYKIITIVSRIEERKLVGFTSLRFILFPLDSIAHYSGLRRYK